MQESLGISENSKNYNSSESHSLLDMVLHLPLCQVQMILNVSTEDKGSLAITLNPFHLTHIYFWLGLLCITQEYVGI